MTDKRIGNQFWQARYNHGRKPKIASAAQLKNAAIKYLEELQANPFEEVKAGFSGGEANYAYIPKMRAPTLQGFWVWINISKDTWYLMRNGDRKGFAEVCEWIEAVFYDWKFQGAAAGFLNHAIIARDLGLKERTDLTSDDEKIDGIVVSYD